MQYGHTPVGTRGEDASSKQFTTLHGVQRHMVDRNTCRLVYEDNEDEYEDFYDYAALDAKLAEQSAPLSPFFAVANEAAPPPPPGGGVPRHMSASFHAHGNHVCWQSCGWPLYCMQRASCPGKPRYTRLEKNENKVRYSHSFGQLPAVRYSRDNWDRAGTDEPPGY